MMPQPTRKINLLRNSQKKPKVIILNLGNGTSAGNSGCEKATVSSTGVFTRKRQRLEPPRSDDTGLISSLPDSPVHSSQNEAEKFYAHMAAIRGTVEKKKKSVVGLSEQREELVRERLAESGYCRLDTLSCKIGNCTRSFQSVRVLAWHMSYAHADADSDLEFHSLCLVCGRKMKSVKGKNSHLVTAHRDLCVLHNAQCIQQRVPPRAKPRKPVVRAASKRIEEEEEEEDSFVNRYLLNDELSYDEDSDYEEDVSVENSFSDLTRASSFLNPLPGGKRNVDGNPSTSRTTCFPSGKPSGVEVEIEASIDGGGIVARGTKFLNPKHNEPRVVVQEEPEQFVVVDDDVSSSLYTDSSNCGIDKVMENLKNEPR